MQIECQEESEIKKKLKFEDWNKIKWEKRERRKIAKVKRNEREDKMLGKKKKKKKVKYRV